MRNETFAIVCSIPEGADLLKRFPRMGLLRQPEYGFLKALLLTPETFLAGRVATEMGRPAIAGVAQKIREAWTAASPQPKWNTTKQAAGAILCALMAANGYEKTADNKGSVGQPGFTVGQLYQKRQDPEDAVTKLDA